MDCWRPRGAATISTSRRCSGIARRATDAGDYWVVDTVLAERPVSPGAATTWHLSAGEAWFTAVGDHVELLREAVACAPGLCAELTTVDPVAGRLVDIEYAGDAAMPLRAVGVRPVP